MGTLLSVQFCYEPDAVLKNKVYYFFKNGMWISDNTWQCRSESKDSSHAAELG